MRTKSKVLNLSSKLALAIVVACSGLLVSCYEKESIDAEGQKPVAVYHIAGVVTDFNSGGVLSGVNVKVTGDYAAATTGANGEFSISLGAITPESSGYTVTFTKAGYDVATKIVYISAVNDGLTSITTANTALRVSGTPSEGPAAPPAKDAEAVSKTDMDAVKGELEDKVEAVFESAKNDLVAALGGKAITIAPTTTVTLPNGDVEATTPITLTAPITTQDMTYAYTLTTGFEVVGDIVVVAAPTRAIGDKITDPTTIADFKKSVGSELDMPVGFKTIAKSVNYPVPTGYKVLGYKIVNTIKTQKHMYLINGNYLSGKASVYTAITIIPVYESHNSHNSHDGHGFNPNAGGGSSN